jgi:DNA polymerase-3 subunit gamma/tau
VLFPPNSLKYKIYIIDEVHMLSTSAFNALLKTIEEPPPYVVFIFATTELHKVPATIKSRCQQFHFRLVAAEKIKELLAQAASEVGIEADDEALYWIARESGGSIRDAYTLFDQVAAFSSGRVTYDKIRDKLGLVGTEQLNALCEKCAAGEAAAALQTLDEIFAGGVSVEQFISNMADYLRSLLFIQQGVTKETLLGQAAGRFSAAALAAWKTAALERALSIFLTLYRDVRYSLNQRYEVDLAVSRLCWLSSWVSPPEVKAAIDDARRLLLGASGDRRPLPPPTPGGAAPRPFADGGTGNSGPVSPAGVIPEAPVSNPGLTLPELREQALSHLAESRGMTASALGQTSNWITETLTDTEASIRMEAESEFVARQVSRDADAISQALSALWGRQVRLHAAVRAAQTEDAAAPAGNAAAPAQSGVPLQAEILRRVFRGTIMEDKK